MIISESIKSTDATLLLGNALYSDSLSVILPEPAFLWALVLIICTLEITSLLPVGRLPSQIPLTVVTPSTVILVLPTPITRVNVAVSRLVLENLTRLPTVTIPTKEKPGSTGIEILEELPTSGEHVALPIS